MLSTKVLMTSKWNQEKASILKGLMIAIL